MLAILRAKNQITLPKVIIDKLKLHEKDKMDIEVNENGQIILTPIDFVEKKLMNDVKEALEDIKAGKVSEPMSAEAMIKKLGL